MRRRSAPFAVFAVLLIAGMALPAAAAAASAAPVQALTPAASAGISPLSASNWAGYGAVGAANHTVTDVSASWVEPTLKCTSTTAIAVFWVGIDGMVTTAPSVEQTGTLGECVGGVASYAAWWEIFPVNSIQVIPTITVSPGDHFNASVSYSTSTSKFTMKITDTTTGASFVKKRAYTAASRATAECIAERPSGGSGLYPLANFAKATFTDCVATISGTHGGIGTFAKVYEITMTTPVHSLAVPGSLTAKKTFTVTWKHSS